MNVVKGRVEKRRPTHDLGAIKMAFRSVEDLAITTSALRDAAALGFDRRRIVDTIATIERSMFCKSMTTFADHRAWQDVYHVPTEATELYVKFQANVVTAFMIVSFKER